MGEAFLIFCDGASSGNPGPGGWGTIIVDPSGKVSEWGGRDPNTTNNRMELIASIQGLNRVHAEKVEVYTDSTYVIRGITQWIWGWRKKGWKTAEGNEVTNQDLWQELSRAVTGKKVDWRYVRGHSGIPGNERADEIAVAFSRSERISLYSGPLLKYEIPIHDLPENFELPEMRPREEKPKAFSYLSLVGGVPMKHATWAECETRVKGRSGAKFKKAMNEAEEKEILRGWGINA